MSQMKTLIAELIHDLTSQTFESEKYISLGYYFNNSHSQIFTWEVSNDFVGDIWLQVTLKSEPSNSDDWSNIEKFKTIESIVGNYNLVGNFVWVRFKIENWISGTLHNISAMY